MTLKGADSVAWWGLCRRQQTQASRRDFAVKRCGEAGQLGATVSVNPTGFKELGPWVAAVRCGSHSYSLTARAAKLEFLGKKENGLEVLVKSKGTYTLYTCYSLGKTGMFRSRLRLLGI